MQDNDIPRSIKNSKEIKKLKTREGIVFKIIPIMLGRQTD